MYLLRLWPKPKYLIRNQFINYRSTSIATYEPQAYDLLRLASKLSSKPQTIKPNHIKCDLASRYIFLNRFSFMSLFLNRFVAIVSLRATANWGILYLCYELCVFQICVYICYILVYSCIVVYTTVGTVDFQAWTCMSYFIIFVDGIRRRLLRCTRNSN